MSYGNLHACLCVLLTTVTGVFVRAVLTVAITITDPALGDAVARVTLEAAGLAGVVAHCGSREQHVNHKEHNIS